jgi:protein involved in polysaccharide export with SLBB domain
MEQPSFSCRRLSVLLYLISFYILGYGSAACAQSSVQAVGAVTVNDLQSEVQNPFKKGDAFRLIVSRDTAHFLTGIYQIDDNGEALLPIVGNVKVDTWSEKKLTTYLDSLYLPYLRFPDLRVQPLMRLALLGGFAKPGLYYLSPTSSLWDAVALAGGPVREDGLKKIHWERGTALVKGNLLPDLEAGASLSKIGLRSGDQLWVTHVPKRDGWEIFQTEVLPILSISVTTVSALATVYFAYVAYQGRK